MYADLRVCVLLEKIDIKLKNTKGFPVSWEFNNRIKRVRDSNVGGGERGLGENHSATYLITL